MKTLRTFNFQLTRLTAKILDFISNNIKKNLAPGNAQKWIPDFSYEEKKVSNHTYLSCHRQKIFPYKRKLEAYSQ